MDSGDKSRRDATPSKAPDRQRKFQRPLTGADVLLYKLSDDFSEGLIYLMVVFSPWAFGTTQPWSIWTMNAAGLLLGLLLAVKIFIRSAKGFRPPRWDQFGSDSTKSDRDTGLPGVKVLTRMLALLTALILLYVLVSAVNARSTYNVAHVSFTEHDYIPWLPHSFDSGRTWDMFWSLLGLAGAFWATRDWLLGKSAAEQPGKRAVPGYGREFFFPARLRRLLWLLALNGGLLALEGIVQRLEGSGRLLFLVKPRVNPGAEAQFGPYAYRANAAQYFNLLWPVCLGFWWTLHRSGGFKRALHHLLLLSGIVMAACPIISTSRGGALITGGLVVAAGLFLLLSHFLLLASKQQDRRTRRFTFVVIMLFFISALGVGYKLGWTALRPRLDQFSEGFVLREEMYDAARPMARDYAPFGTGPGTFEYVFQLYRISTDTYWPAQLHNDWLETRITFGWMGMSLLLVALLAVILRWFARGGGIHGGRRFTVLTWLALAGCLVHARFDFPFQVHSILFLFILLCAMLFCLTRRPA
jgi:hypothetical protein